MTQVLPDPNRFYRALLGMAKLEVSAEGLVSEITDDGEKLPFFVNGMRLVIPEDAQLRVTGEERVFFQPGRENIMLGETKEFAAFRKRLNDQMQIRIMAIVAELLVLAGSPKEHPKLKGRQLELLRGLEEISKSTFEAFKGLLKVTSEGDATQQPFSLYLGKNDKLGDKSYRRTAIVSFPLYEQLVKDGQTREEIMARRKEQSKERREELPKNETFGVELGKHDRPILLRVFEYIFPLIAQKGAYSMGSNSDYFPYLEAFCLAMQNVAECINRIVDEFGTVVPTLEGQRINLEWVDAIADAESLYRAAKRVPDQNMGGAVHQKGQPMTQGAIPVATELPPDQPNVHNVSPAQVGMPPGVAVPPPIQQQQPAPAQQGQPRKEKTLADLFGPRPMPQGHPQQMMPPMGYPPMGYPQHQQPQYPMQQQQQPQHRVYMGGGMPGMPGMQPMGMQQPQQQQNPGFYMPVMPGKPNI
jgi:hypothetical protein